MNINNHKIFFLLVLLICVWISCKNEKVKEQPLPKAIDSKQKNNTLTKDEIAVGWELLFDGKNLNHWKGYNQQEFPNEEWKIDSSKNLIPLNEGTTLISKRKFENFEFKLEYQLTSGTSCGIYYRVIEAESYPIWFNAPKFTLMDDEEYLKNRKNHPNAQKHLNSGVFDVFEPNIDLSFPKGKWNQVRIVVHSNFVEHWLNGSRVLEYQIDSTDWKSRVQQSKFKNYLNYGKAKLGHIGLQGNKLPVKFRNIKIREL